MKRQDVYASTQILCFNPILEESFHIRNQYFEYLKKLICLVGWSSRKYTKAQIVFYKEKLCKESESFSEQNKDLLDIEFCYFLPYDVAAIVGFYSTNIETEKIQRIIDKIVCDFKLKRKQREFLSKEFLAAFGDDDEAWNYIFRSSIMKRYKQYLKIVRDNIVYINMIPYNILITATMSAGKSTLINTLVGKSVSLMQNLACTSKIHTIISKAFEDGVTSEYDYELKMNASKADLLNDNSDNKTSKIVVGTHFNGNLAGRRIVLHDSPGVNSSENYEHMKISHKMIKSKKYHLIIYVLNATQLGTTDEEQHLEVVKKNLGRSKIVFVMNKVDKLLTEDDNVVESIDKQKKFLMSKGFKNPIICPVSSRAAFLAKKSQRDTLSRIEKREIEYYLFKFEQQSLSTYYEQELICAPILADNENDLLMVNCGMAYLERIIINICDGGK